MTTRSGPARAKLWRGDLAGLRGIAVLAVLLFHAVPAWLPGGFAGVDIFFVLSGFLMARLIMADVDAGAFTYRAFYARRARRLFPPLILVLCATLAVAPIFLYGEDLKALGLQIAASAAFVGNFLAWSQAGYFGGDAAFKPLIHLWSLGVEEQFYLLFPVCFVYSLRRSSTAAAPFLVAACVASAVACVFLTDANPDAAFYLPITRFWELLAGARVALAERESDGRPAPRLANALSIAGVAFLAGSLALLNEDSPFPGWRAGGPVIGACLLLYAGPATWIGRRILARGPLLWFGEVSYAAYLWHWPLLVFARYQMGESLPPVLALGLTACAVLLAWRSTIMVEKPFRSGAMSTARMATPSLVVVMSVVAVAASPLAGILRARSEFIERVQMTQYRLKGDAWRKADKCFIDVHVAADFGVGCMGGPEDGRPLALLWGDSHAASMWTGLAAEAEAHGVRLAQFTVSSCAPLIEPVAYRNLQCPAMRDRSLAAIEKLKPQMVILGARWAFGYPEDAVLRLLEPTIAWLKKAGVARVVVLGPLPMYYPSLPAAVIAEAMKTAIPSPPASISKGLYENAFTMTPLLRARAERAGAEFLSPIENLCEGRNCRIWADPGARDMLMAYDEAHLTPEGSRVAAGLLADRVFGARVSLR